MKRGSEYFAVPTHDRDVVLPNASYPGSFEGLLRSLEGTAEFETFRPFVMEPDNGVNEDETRSSTAHRSGALAAVRQRLSCLR